MMRTRLRTRRITLATLVSASCAVVLPVSPAQAADVLRVDVTRLSVRADGGDSSGHVADAAVAANGQWVAFSSDASDMVLGDENGYADIFVRNSTTGGVVRVSVASDGSESDGDSSGPSLSADGRFVAFLTESTTFDENDLNVAPDLYVRDRDTDADGIFDEAGAVSTTRVSVSPDGDESETGASAGEISPQGDAVVFVTDFGFVNSDQNDGDDVYLRRISGATSFRRLSTGRRTDGGGGAQPTFSGNGRFVVFQSFATDVDGGQYGVFASDRDADNDAIYDEANPVTRIVSLKASGQPSIGTSLYPDVSGTGRFVTFVNYATDLLAGGLNEAVYVVDRDTDNDGIFGEPGAIGVELVSRSDAGTAVVAAKPAISPNGRYVTFESASPTLVPGDTAVRDVYRRDRQTAKTVRLSVTPSGAGANSPSFNGPFAFVGSNPGAVDDSGTAYFLSLATNMSVRGGNPGGLELYRASTAVAPASATYVARFAPESVAFVQQAAVYWGVPLQDLGSTGVAALAFITGLAGGGSQPTPPVANVGPLQLAATYTPGSDGQRFTDTVAAYFAVDGDQAHAFGATFMTYVYLLLNPPA